MASLSHSEEAAYAARGVSLRVASRSHVGLARANNEDSLILGNLARGRPSLGSGRVGRAGVMLGVCDGMGGAAAGEVASRLAARVIFDQLARSPSGINAAGFRDALSAAVVQAGEAIRRHTSENPSDDGMGTTCTVGAVRGGLLVIAQVGDSRAYLMRGGELRQLTTDQTWANEMLARGRVSPEQAAAMENGKAITQALGTSEAIEVELITLELWQGDRILICSDGLSGMVPDSDIARVLTAAEELELASDELLRLALERGGRDNVSFVLCEFRGNALGMADSLEDEYRLPVKRGPARAAAFCLAVMLLGATLWRVNESGERDHGRVGAARDAAALRTAPSAKSDAALASSQNPSSLRAPTAKQEPVGPEPAPVAGSDVKEASVPRLRAAIDSSARRPRPGAAAPRRAAHRAESTPRIDRPLEEEIHIMREDDPSETSPF